MTDPLIADAIAAHCAWPVQKIADKFMLSVGDVKKILIARNLLKPDDPEILEEKPNKVKRELSSEEAFEILLKNKQFGKNHKSSSYIHLPDKPEKEVPPLREVDVEKLRVVAENIQLAAARKKAKEEADKKKAEKNASPHIKRQLYKDFIEAHPDLGDYQIASKLFINIEAVEMLRREIRNKKTPPPLPSDEELE